MKPNAPQRTTPAPPQASAAAPTAPLRNQIDVDLLAAPDKVWALVGNVARMPDYSAGLERVDAVGPATRPTAYVCHFRPQEGTEAIVHREDLVAHGPFMWSSRAEEPNAFGLRDSLTEVRVQARLQGCRLAWSQRYHADNVGMMKQVFDLALADIAARLVAKFGGRLARRFVEP